jgi:hypothetical protein
MKQASGTPLERRRGSHKRSTPTRRGGWVREYLRYGYRLRLWLALEEGAYDRSYEPEPKGLEMVDGVLRPQGLFYES